MKREIYSDPLRHYFVWEWEETETGVSWVDFKVYEVTGVELNGDPRFLREGYSKTPDPVKTTEEAQVLFSGYMKWDGCHELHWKDNPHLCGKTPRDNLIGAIWFVTDGAQEILNRPEEWE